MIRNPLTRRRRSPVDQVLDAVDGVRSEAIAAASTVRDAATKTVDALGEATPSVSRVRLPLAGAAFGAAIGIALAIRARAKSATGEPGPAQPSYPTAAETAARTTAKTADATTDLSADKGEREESASTVAKTAEASGTSKTPAEEVELSVAEGDREEPAEPKAQTPESEAAADEGDESA